MKSPDDYCCRIMPEEVRRAGKDRTPGLHQARAVRGFDPPWAASKGPADRRNSVALVIGFLG
jgi:hypothetical protein